MTRTFIAVDVGEKARAALTREIALLRRALPDVRFVDPESLHITLVFLGELDDEAVAAATAATREAASAHRPFALALHGLGTFGPPHAPRVLWAGLGGDIRDLTALQGTLADALERRGFPREARPFAPHLTLARLKQRPDPRALSALAAHLAAPHLPRAEWPVEAARVMASELRPTGARYTVLHAVPLGTR